MNSIDILYQFNEKYAPYGGASITSLLKNNTHLDEIRIFILGEELSEESQFSLRNLAAKYGRPLSFVNTEKLIYMMKKMNMPTYRGSYAANMRLYLSYVLEDDVKRLLYLDADTIVDGPLDSLIELDMCEHPVAMVLDSLVRKHKKRLGFSGDEYYYNSGVMLFDMKEWRKHRCSERIANHVKNVRAWYPSPDQDLINVVLKGEILKLGPQYNMQPVLLAFDTVDYFRVFGTRGYYTYEEVRMALKEPVIYHFFRFVGEFPWHEGNVHPDNDLFDKYIKLSPWKGYVKRPSGAGVILRLEKVLYKRLPKKIFIVLFRIAYECFIRKANSDSLKMRVNRIM
ncbi:MAG: glycosyltransferase family 8 protein [Lachnospiraceae bacterium]|nr:glycosyltransferase family 8 protein [Lachnospiraceae bacterium]